MRFVAQINPFMEVSAGRRCPLMGGFTVFKLADKVERKSVFV